MVGATDVTEREELRDMAEITHRRDPDTGSMVQIVSPKRLREILDADGETYDPPSGFGPADEWDVDEDA